jgi:hypothetical protein
MRRSAIDPYRAFANDRNPASNQETTVAITDSSCPIGIVAAGRVVPVMQLSSKAFLAPCILWDEQFGI